jgi:carbon-monoxide dehydrogenase large subunit
VGEVGTIPAAAAIISAVEDALQPFGVHIAQVPITPPKLLKLIEAGRLLSPRPGGERSAARSADG